MSRFLFAFFVTALTTLPTRAGDWPQILGPGRDGRATGEQLAEWPAAGPPKAWQAKLGTGYAGPAIVGRKVIAFHRVDDNERIDAFDLANGDHLWRTDFAATYRPSINPDDGPRCVPLVHDGRVYVFGAAGELHCVRLEDGKRQWSRDVYGDYDGNEGYFGAGSTPIVAGGKLLLNVGGRNTGLAAFSLATGKTEWTATAEKASYSSPIRATIGGTEQAIFITRLSTLAVDPRDGSVLFQFPFGRSGPTVNAAMPLMVNGGLFVTASYGVGSQFRRIANGNTTEAWGNVETLASQYTTPVLYDGHLYGTNGREDAESAQLQCVDAATGKVQWTEDPFPVAHVILVGDELLILTTNGQLTRAKATPVKFAPHERIRVSSGATRALPALGSGRFLFRDNGPRGGTLTCLRVGGR